MADDYGLGHLCITVIVREISNEVVEHNLKNILYCVDGGLV